MRTSSLYILFTVLVCIVTKTAHALFFSEFVGKTTVTVEAAAVRTELDDGVIVGAVFFKDVLTVHRMVGHGNGKWLKVSVGGDSPIEGYIDIRQTSFSEDLAAGRIKRPKLEPPGVKR